MTEPTFFVLTALIGEPRHGYGIVGEVRQLSDGRVELKIGSLYGILDRLVTEGLIEPDREEAHQGRLRRYYRLTNAGFQAVRTEAARQAANARAATHRLRSAKPHLGELASRASRLSGELASRASRLSGELASRASRLSGELASRAFRLSGESS